MSMLNKPMRPLSYDGLFFIFGTAVCVGCSPMTNFEHIQGLFMIVRIIGQEV